MRKIDLTPKSPFHNWRGDFAASVVLMSWLAGCNISSGLSSLEANFQVAAGGLDPALLGTYRLGASFTEEPRMLRLLVLRKDGSYHCELVTDCSSEPCTVEPIDGQYIQTRTYANPTQASGVQLTVMVDEAHLAGGDAGASTLVIMLQRALIASSPQVSLYHDDSADPGIPYFQLVHPYGLWCAVDADCEAQVQTPKCAYACSAGLCSCP